MSNRIWVVMIILSVAVAAAIVWIFFAGDPFQRSAPAERPAVRPAEPPMEFSGEMGELAREAETYKRASPEEAHEALVSGKGILLDVRTHEEYEKEYIPGSVLVTLAPMEEFAPEVLKAIPDKDRPVYLFCRSGIRSYQALRLMERLGYTDVHNMGGIIHWKWDVEEGRKRNATRH